MPSLLLHENCTRIGFCVDDRCCNDGDVAMHDVVKIFDYILRAPYKDGFHGVDAVSRECNSGADPAEKAAFISKLGSILRQRHKPDVNKVIQYLMHREKKPIKTESEARAAASHKQYSKYIRTLGRPGN